MAEAINYAVNLDASAFVAGMKKVEDSARQALTRVESSATPLASVFQRTNLVLGGMVALLAGGVFAHAISETVEWGSEQGKLSRQLQITSEAAAGLQVAAEDVGVESGTLIGASDKLAKALASNEGAFATLGIETRNAGGAYRSTGELLPEVIDKLRGIQNVTEQNVAGQKLFGKSWSDVRGILKLSAEAIAEATERARELHLVTDPDQIRAYKLAMNDVKDIGQSLSIQVGSQLLPVLTTLGQFMGDQAPAFGAVFAGALRGIGFVAGAVWITLKDMGDSIGALAAQTVALMHFDLDAVKAIGAARDAEYARNEASFNKLKDGLFGGAEQAKPRAAGGGDGADQGHLDFGAEGSRAAEKLRLYQDKLDEALAIQKLYGEQAKSYELRYWQAILNGQQIGSEEYLGVQRKVYALLNEQHQKSVTDAKRAVEARNRAELEGLRAQEEAAGKDYDKKLAIAQTAQARALALYGRESGEYQRASDDIVKIERDKQAQLVELKRQQADTARQGALAQVDFEQQMAQIQLQGGQITREQLLQMQEEFERRKFEIEQRALQERLSLVSPTEDPVQYQQTLDQLLLLRQGYENRMRLMQAQATLGDNKGFSSMMASLQGTWARGLQAMAQGTLSFRNAVSGVFTSIGSAFLNMVSQSVAGWLLGELKKTATTQASSLARTGIEAGAAAQSLAISAGTGIKDIAIKAYQAAAGAYAALSAIPYVGPFIAPAVAGATLATVIGFGAKIASASGGYDIPAGVNPLVQAHAEEMILPAKQANVIRDIADGGGAAGGSISVHISALDAAGVNRLVRSESFRAALRAAARDGYAR